jgi:dCMP deaminase
MMQNPDKLFMDIAIRIAEESTCARMAVGSVLVANNRILATGYNGVPSGCTHCKDLFNEEDLASNSAAQKNHHQWTRVYELHSEVNAIIDAGKRGVLTDNMTLYVTVFPCVDCAKIAVAAGVKRVVFLNMHDSDPCNLATNTFGNSGVTVEQFKNDA